jgi:drug/metabolite transporter (DMT)-like permease
LNPRARLYALIALMSFGWAANYIAAKIALQAFPPLVFYAVRALMAALLILPAYWWEQRRGTPAPTRRDVPMLVVLGLVGIALNQFLFIVGLSRTSVAHASIFANMTPVLVLLLARARGLERITPRKVTGLVVALAGVVILQAFDRNPQAGGATLLGDALTLGGAFVFAGFTVLSKPLAKWYSGITVNTWAYTMAAVLVAPACWWHPAGFAYARVPAAAWACVFFVALLPSVICNLIYYYALGRMEASRLSAFLYVQPPVATLMGIAVLGEPVTVWLAISGAVILLGVYLAERGQ